MTSTKRKKNMLNKKWLWLRHRAGLLFAIIITWSRCITRSRPRALAAQCAAVTWWMSGKRTCQRGGPGFLGCPCYSKFVCLICTVMRGDVYYYVMWLLQTYRFSDIKPPGLGVSEKICVVSVTIGFLVSQVSRDSIFYFYLCRSCLHACCFFQSLFAFTFTCLCSVLF